MNKEDICLKKKKEKLWKKKTTIQFQHIQTQKIKNKKFRSKKFIYISLNFLMQLKDSLYFGMNSKDITK